MSSHAIASSRAADDRGHRPYARSLLRSFGLTALLVVTLIGVVLGLALRSSIRDRAIADAARTAEVAAGVGVLPYLTVDDVDRSFAPLGSERLDEIDRVLGNSLSPNGIVRIKVWNRQHWIVYSDNPNMVGRWFPESELLGRAFDGETTSEITDLTAPEEREEREFGRLLSVYVPLREAPDGDLSIDGAGEVIGAFEIYLPWQPIAAQIARDSFELYAALGMGLLVLYLALFRLVAGASRTITRQGDENLRRATTDELTGLANRERFSERLGELIRERRQHRTPISLLLLDVDGFQKINDTLGHDRGDLVIQQIARRLVARMRVGDEVARLGGDEFGVILDGVTDGETHRSVADRLLRVLDEPIEVDGIQLDVRCSVGLSRWPEDGDSAAELLRRADIAMYAAKRDQTTIAEYASDLDHYSPDALELVGDVRAGIRNDEFWLVYQPQFALDTGEAIGAEALVRWTHPTRGFVPPGAFIPALETLPACRELTDHVLGLAIGQLAAWHAADLAVTMSVNLSARDASDPDLPHVIDRLLAAHGVDARFLHLELTEGTALVRPDRTRSVLAELRALGCGVAIDDFGTGFASLSYLTSLPITELKIDRSFVAGLDRNPTDTAIVRHSIDLGHSLGLTVVAEGVEEPATLAALRALGCDVVQGFLLAKPTPAAEVDLTARHAVGANVPAPDDPDHGEVPS